MSSFKRKLARQNEAPKSEEETAAEHAAGLHTQPRPQLKLGPRNAAPTLDRGRVLRRKSAGR